MTITIDSLQRPEYRAALNPHNVRQLLAAGGDVSPEYWDLGELADLTPAALSTYLASMADNDTRQQWIDETFYCAEQYDPNNEARYFDLAWAANDCAVLLKHGANPERIYRDPYKGIAILPDDFTGDIDIALRLGVFDDLERRLTESDLCDGTEENMETPNDETQPARFKLLSPAELLALPPLRWRVRGILPAEGLAALYGPPGCGKSFLAIDLLAAIAEGRPWFEHTTTAAPVVYCALEGEAGIAQRVQAYCAKRAAPERLRVVLSALDIRNSADRMALADAIRADGMGDGVLCLDTLNRAAAGIDENNAAEMGLLIEAAKDLREQVGGLVLLCHHAGKDVTRGLRGHSSLLAALDAVLEITRDGERRGWQLTKAKDAGDEESRPFRLDLVELGTDAEGWPVSSCVVEPTEATTEAVRKSAAPGGVNQRIAWDVLGELLRASQDFGKGNAPASRPCVRLETALDAIGPRMPCEAKRQRDRAQTAITGLIGRPGCLMHLDGWLWHP